MTANTKVQMRNWFDLSSKVAAILCSVLVTFLIFGLSRHYEAFGGVQEMAFENGASIREMQANRFTSGDGLEVWKEIGSIRNDLAKLPPAAMLQRIAALEVQVKGTNATLAKVEKAIIALSKEVRVTVNGSR